MRLSTIHRSDVVCGLYKQPTQRAQEPCTETHFVAVPAIELRGTWKVRDMVSDQSLHNAYVAGRAIKGGRK